MAEPKKPTPSVDEPTPIPGSIRAPVDLGPAMVSAMRDGAMHYGEAVEEVRVRVGGEWRGYRLPPPVETEKGITWTPTRRRIVAALAESPVPLNRKQLGNAVGRQPWGGKFGADLAALLGDGSIIFERDGLLTNDAKKFPQLS